MNKELVEKVKCKSCGSEWPVKRQRAVRSNFMGLCKKCYNRVSRKLKSSNHHNWKGGTTRDARGYIMVMVDSTNPYFSMADKDGYIKEHRLVMAEYLGRCLLSSEIIHHISGDVTDNRLVNLALLTNRNSHYCIHRREKWIAEEIKEGLEKEFIWGQVPYHDIASGTMKEWTMRCISDEDLQAFWSKIIKEG